MSRCFSCCTKCVTANLFRGFQILFLYETFLYILILKASLKACVCVCCVCVDFKMNLCRTVLCHKLCQTAGVAMVTRPGSENPSWRNACGRQHFIIWHSIILVLIIAGKSEAFLWDIESDSKPSNLFICSCVQRPRVQISDYVSLDNLHDEVQVRTL